MTAARVTVQFVHEMTGADIDGLRRQAGYDADTDTLPHDISWLFKDDPPKPGPLQPPVGLDRRHG